jgi:hypothetical protein
MSNASQVDPTGHAPATNGAQPPLNAQQLDVISEFQRAVDDVEMRKQAVDAACKIISAQPAPGGIAINPVDLARELYAFMAEPGAAIVVDLKVT